MRWSHTIHSRAALRPLATCAALAVLWCPAFADQGQITWTTYLYQGPGTHYSVVGEVPQATNLDVGTCKDGWCEVRYAGRNGFVMSELVAKGDPSKPAPGLLPQPAASIVAQPAGPCFEVNQKGGNGGNAMTYVCAK